MAVSTIKEAVDNLVAGVTGKGAKYDKKHDDMTKHFNNGFDKFGFSPGDVTKKLYANGTDNKGAKMEKNAIAGAKAKWEDNWKAGLQV